MLNTRTAIQQGGWQMVGFLITAGTAILTGLVIGVLIKIINKHEYQDQFNDS
jgi:NhaP-type Na+/H+ or K+/H+ antiporter